MKATNRIIPNYMECGVGAPLTVNLIDVINDIKLDIPENAHLTYDADMQLVKANKTQAYQLFQNLISNGIKYQPKDQKPEVQITWEKQGLFWQFCISDNGIGIEPRHQKKIFDVFRRLHRHQAYPGTGIGLSICKKIVERYGGLIWMESELNKGSKIFFQLPSLNELNPYTDSMADNMDVLWKR
jgi:signal transduction histidine kinase